MSPVGRLVFNTSEALIKCLVGSTPTSSANSSLPGYREQDKARRYADTSTYRYKNGLIAINTVINTLSADALLRRWPTWILVGN